MACRNGGFPPYPAASKIEPMRRLLIELVALMVAGAFGLVALRLASADDDVAFWIALIGSMALWEGTRFVLLRGSKAGA